MFLRAPWEVEATVSAARRCHLEPLSEATRRTFDVPKLFLKPSRRDLQGYSKLLKIVLPLLQPSCQPLAHRLTRFSQLLVAHLQETSAGPCLPVVASPSCSLTGCGSGPARALAN